MYKKSKFNIYSQYENKLIIYNTLSGGLLSLQKKYGDLFHLIDTNGECPDKELEENLKKGKMIVDNDMDENSYLDVLHNMLKYNASQLSLTIAPTLECNFACTYCYEKGRRFHSMNADTEEKIIAYIDENMKSDKNSLSITWYGGEPLLGISVIKRISEHIISKKYQYSSSMVTNGYLLNREMAQILKDCRISHVQVTLDGPPSTHDKRRMLTDGKPTFEKILSNISESCDLIDICIRVNVDKKNINAIGKMLDIFDTYGLKGKISVYLAPVDNINGTCTLNSCLNNEEFAKENVAFYKKYNDRGYSSLSLPRPNLYICGAVNPYSLIIAPDGDLYKCWDDIGDKGESIGNIAEYYSFSPKNIAWITQDYLADEECRSCTILPVCMGGCPNVQMKRKEKKCNSLKYNYQEIISMLAR